MRRGGERGKRTDKGVADARPLKEGRSIVENKIDTGELLHTLCDERRKTRVSRPEEASASRVGHKDIRTSTNAT